MISTYHGHKVLIFSKKKSLICNLNTPIEGAFFRNSKQYFNFIREVKNCSRLKFYELEIYIYPRALSLAIVSFSRLASRLPGSIWKRLSSLLWFSQIAWNFSFVSQPKNHYFENQKFISWLIMILWWRSSSNISYNHLITTYHVEKYVKV